MSNGEHDLWDILNKMSADRHNPAVQAVTALVEDDFATVFEVMGTAHMELLQDSGLMDGMDFAEAWDKMKGSPAWDPFTTALLCFAADLLARQTHGVAQARYEALRRSLGPRRL